MAKNDRLHDKANEAIKKRNYPYAVEIYQQCLATDPDDTEARKNIRATVLKHIQENGGSEGGPMAYLRGLVPFLRFNLYYGIKKYELAALEAEKFLIHSPRDRYVLGRLGMCLASSDHAAGAITVFEWLLQNHSANVPALRYMGRLHQEQGDLAKAIRYWEQVKSALPSDGEAARAVRDLAAQGANKQITDASAKGTGTFRDIIRDKSKAAELERAGHLLRTEEDFANAIEAAEARIEEEPENSKHYRALGEIHMKKGDLKSAVASFKRGLEVDPNDNFAKDAIGDAYLRQFDLQIRRLQQSKTPEDRAKIQKTLADKVQFGIKEYRRRAQVYPTDLGIKFNLGQNLFLAKDFDGAIGEFQRVLKDPKRGPEAQTYLGKCFHKKGNLDLALRELSRAREGLGSMNQRNKDITYSIAEVHEAKGEVEKAREEFEKILADDITYRDVAQRVERLREQG